MNCLNILISLLLIGSIYSYTTNATQGCEIVILDALFTKTKILSYDNSAIKPFSGLIDTYYKKYKIPTLQAVRLVYAIDKTLKKIQAEVHEILGHKHSKQKNVYLALGFNLSEDKQATNELLLRRYPKSIVDSMIERCKYYKTAVADVLDKKFGVTKNIREYYAIDDIYAIVKLDQEYSTLFCFPL